MLVCLSDTLSLQGRVFFGLPDEEMRSRVVLRSYGSRLPGLWSILASVPSSLRDTVQATAP
jgi:hypothetical protein